MRDRYWVRIGKVERVIRTISTECYREWKELDQRPDYSAFKKVWLFDNHNIIINKQINGVEKVGFASRGDMLLFVLKYA